MHIPAFSPSALLQPTRISALLSVALLLTACAGFKAGSVQEPTAAEQEALKSLSVLQDRLDRVTAPLLISNTELCKGNARNLFGITAKNKYSYSAELSNAAHHAFDLNERLQVVKILAGSGAARVGVRKGDGLISVEDQVLPQGPNAERQAAAIIAPLVAGKSTVKLSVTRNGANLVFQVPLTIACGFSVAIGNTDNTNAYSDGNRIVITRGMMKFAQSDSELAFVIAKEMAHNELRHQSKQHINSTMGGIIDNLVLLHPDMSTMTGMAGIRPYPKELDAAADALSIYMVARASYNVDGAMTFWQRLAQQYPVTLLKGYTAIHPATAYRLSAIDKAVMDVKFKQASKKPLMPMT